LNKTIKNLLEKLQIDWKTWK